jgi:hypothetical protein
MCTKNAIKSACFQALAIYKEKTMKIEHMFDDELVDHIAFLKKRIEDDQRLALTIMEEDDAPSIPSDMAEHIQAMEEELTYAERELEIRRRAGGILGEKPKED